MDKPKLQWATSSTISFKGYEAEVSAKDGEITWSLFAPGRVLLAANMCDAESLEDAQTRAEEKILQHAKHAFSSLLTDLDPLALGASEKGSLSVDSIHVGFPSLRS